MSQTVYIGDDHSGFWAFDVVCDVFTRHLLEIAEEAAGPNDEWLKERMELWSNSMQSSDLGLSHLDDLSPTQTAIVQALILKAVERLQARDQLTLEELQTGEYYVDTRGIDPIPTEPVARFGMAIHGLLTGTLPKAPKGYWWFYSLKESPCTIRKRSEE